MRSSHPNIQLKCVDINEMIKNRT